MLSAAQRVRAVTSILIVLAGAAIRAQSPFVLQPLDGVVIDATGAVLPGAAVQLTTDSGETIATTTADDAGRFHLDAVRPGRYAVTVTFAGFQPARVAVTVSSSRRPPPVRVTMALAGVRQEVTVSSQTPQLATTAAANADVVNVDQATLDSLPVFDQDAIAALSLFLDPGSIATGGVSLVVNGMEVSGLTVSASALQQIKINQDPYSAEYSRPGRGRIEILTKPGSQQVHGEANVIARDARLNARNAFAPVRPPEQRRIFEGVFGGPVGRGERTSLLVSANVNTENQQAIVFAVGPAGEIRQAVGQPAHHVLFSVGITHQRGDSTISVRPSYEEQSNKNQGVGGTTLGTAGTNYFHREIDLTYGHQTVFRPTLLNQFQILLGQELEPTYSASQAPALVVNGAFTGGGAQIDSRRTELHFQLAESVALTRGRHLIQAGVQVPDWSRRRFDDTTGFGGTFSFSSLAAYTAGRPYAFVQQSGNGHVVFLEKVLGTYVKDDWQLGPHSTLSFGARYDWQNYFSDDNNVAPRVSFAVAPRGSEHITIRGGAGIFYDRIGIAPTIDVLHSRPGGLRRVVITDPSYPDPFAAGDMGSVPSSIVQFAPGIQVPWTLQYSGGIERQLRKATLAVTYFGSEGQRLRSRDVNAPPPPDYAARPDPAFGVVRQIESGGRQRSNALQTTLRGALTRWFNGQMQYTFSRTLNDSSGVGWFPANDYDLAGEWARADFDRLHRFVLLGRIDPGRIAAFGVALNVQSGAPYTETLGGDLYNNGRGNARPPGVARNSLQGAPIANVDLRASRDVVLGNGTPRSRTVTLALDAFNALNRVNYASYVGTVTSPLFAQPVTAQAPRQLQVSVRYKF